MQSVRVHDLSEIVARVTMENVFLHGMWPSTARCPLPHYTRQLRYYLRAKTKRFPLIDAVDNPSLLSKYSRPLAMEYTIMLKGTLSRAINRVLKHGLVGCIFPSLCDYGYPSLSDGCTTQNRSITGLLLQSDDADMAAIQRSSLLRLKVESRSLNNQSSFDRRFFLLRKGPWTPISFTLNGRVCKKGSVDFGGSMPPAEARDFYDKFFRMVQESHSPDLVKDGLFGAKMEVSLVNDGPITVIVDSNEMGEVGVGASTKKRDVASGGARAQGGEASS